MSPGRPGADAPRRGAVQGFTLLEVMIAVTVLGILTTMAQAAWWRHVAKVRRTDATVALLSLAAAQEAHYLDARSYADRLAAAPPEGLGFSGTENGWYQVRIEISGRDRYRLIAAPGPGSPQQLDEDCREFWLDQTGARGSSPAPPATCWQ